MVEAIDSEGPSLPTQPYLRARLVIDITKPPIPGCFLPLDEHRVFGYIFAMKGYSNFVKNVVV